MTRHTVIAIRDKILRNISVIPEKQELCITYDKNLKLLLKNITYSTYLLVNMQNDENTRLYITVVSETAKFCTQLVQQQGTC